ncbi:hypothetical protein V7114_06745 [Neobacillus niacini]|uniref:hypothetical protein n=1 Tax=Neobacillus niacini TaxID=86668 RepID=UPI002FFF2475
MTDVKTKLHEAITQLQQATKRGEMPREVRLGEIEALTEEYFVKAGEWPDSTALERMADLCLWEELTDNDRMKVRNNEYPFFSETQFEERRKSETSFKLSEEQGVDGRNHKPPTRRDRSNREIKFIDKHARIRNKERKKRYDKFTKVQPVIIHKIDDFAR